MAGVEVRTSAILRTWRQAGEARTLLRTEGADVGAVERVLRAGGEADGVHVEWVLPSPDGPVAFLASLGEPDLEAWLVGVARDLEALGIAGRLEPAPEVADPTWIPVTSTPTAFLSLPPEAVAETAPTVAAWGGPAGPDVIVGFELRWAVTDRGDLGQVLRAELGRGPTTAALWHDDGARRARHVVLDDHGSVLAQALDEAAPWAARVDAARDLLLPLADRLQQGFVRLARTTAPGWVHLDRYVKLPGFRESLVRANRHLLDRFVPDAHGVQVLSDAHLERAHDLSGWTITDLGSGRHLVEAADLEPWYAGERTDPGVLERARADFGAMVLSREAVAAHPPPGVE